MSGIPTYQDLMLPVLRLIAGGHETIPECVPLLADQFELDQEQREQLLPSGKQTVLSNRAHWARNYMSHAGLVSSVRRGHYILTDEGRVLLDSNPAAIDNKLLKTYPMFREWWGLDKTDRQDGASAEDEAGDVTPTERIERAFEQILSELRAELQSLVLDCDPTRFEQIIVDLLVAMGYGGGDPRMGERLGKSGDGGIDGVINEDPLGLDAVYIQAKRYRIGNNIGRPDIQQFVGSLTGEGANKGVFVTTSDFSREALAYVEKVQHRIVLINGRELARLMIRHGVGVRARQTYVVQSVDEDYFADPNG